MHNKFENINIQITRLGAVFGETITIHPDLYTIQ